MRAIWADGNNDVDYVKNERYAIDEPYFDARWVAAKPDPLGFLKSVRARTPAQTPGLYLCSQGTDWPSHFELTGAEWADWAYDLVQKKIAPGTRGGFPRVCLNNEIHDAVWIEEMLIRWRQRSPLRWTSWSMEGHQTGWMPREFVDRIAPLLQAVHPQSFRGNMERFESDRVALEMVAAGFPVEKVYCVLAADDLGQSWDGVALPQGRLP